MSWILNADIILKNSNFEFKRNFIESIIIQTNHLKKILNLKLIIKKKIEILTTIILSGLVFKEYEENYEYSLRELNKLINIFFDEIGFPVTRNPDDLYIYAKHLLLIREIYKGRPEICARLFRPDIREKSSMFKKHNNSKKVYHYLMVPLKTNLTNFYDYLNHFKIKIKKIKYNPGVFMYSKIKKILFFLRQEILLKRTFLIAINQVHYLLNTIPKITK